MAKTAAIRYGFREKPLEHDEIDVLGEALDSYQEAMRYSATLADGPARKERFEKARVATELLRRVAFEEER